MKGKGKEGEMKREGRGEAGREGKGEGWGGKYKPEYKSHLLF